MIDFEEIIKLRTEGRREEAKRLIREYHKWKKEQKIKDSSNLRNIKNYEFVGDD